MWTECLNQISLATETFDACESFGMVVCGCNFCIFFWIHQLDVCICLHRFFCGLFHFQVCFQDLQRLVQLATGFGPTLLPGWGSRILQDFVNIINNAHAITIFRRVMQFCISEFARWNDTDELAIFVLVDFSHFGCQAPQLFHSASLNGWCSGHCNEWQRTWRRAWCLKVNWQQFFDENQWSILRGIWVANCGNWKADSKGESWDLFRFSLESWWMPSWKAVFGVRNVADFPVATSSIIFRA